MITSPYINKIDRKGILLETRLKKVLDKEKLEGVCVFYIPRDDKMDVNMFDKGLCSHQLKKLGETILELSEVRECEDLQ